MLRLATLNINGYGTKYGEWARRRNLIARTLASADADVIALQAVRKAEDREAGLDQASQIARLLPGRWHVEYHPATRVSELETEGSAFISRLPFFFVEALHLEKAADQPDKVTRLVLKALLQADETPVSLFNCHFSWVEEELQRNIKQAREYICSGRSCKIIVGDFNASPQAAPLEDLRAAGFTDVWMCHHPDDPGCTFEFDSPTMRIDYAWVDAFTKTASAALLPAARENGAGLSDHRGLIVEAVIGESSGFEEEA